MKKSLLSILIFMPLFVAAQKKGSNEFSFAIANTYNFNNRDVTSTLSSGNLDMKNTFNQNISGRYARVTNYNLVLTTGIELGYQTFKGQINYPFSQYGFVKPMTLSDEYNINATTLYGNFNLGIGYRLYVDSMPIDIIVGNLMRIPVTSKQEVYHSLEVSTEGAEIYNYYKAGHFGKLQNSGFTSEQISYIYIGSKLKNILFQKDLSIALRAESKLIAPNAGLNALNVYYYDKNGVSVGYDSFTSRQFAFSFIFGITL